MEFIVRVEARLAGRGVPVLFLPKLTFRVMWTSEFKRLLQAWQPISPLVRSRDDTSLYSTSCDGDCCATVLETTLLTYKVHLPLGCGYGID